MASITVQVAGYDAEIDIPGDDDVMAYLCRECMLLALDRREISYDVDQVAALQALRVAIIAHFPDLPTVNLTEE